MLNPRQLPLAFFLSIVTLAGSAAADDKESAKKLFEQGIEQMDAKNYDRACPSLEQSQKLDPHAGTLFALAECEALRGHAAAAFARYGEYLEVHASLPRDKQRKQGSREKEARAKRAELEQITAEATLTLPPSAPEGTVVTRDGVTLSAASLTAAAKLDPGDHVVTTQAPGGPVTEQRFTLGKGERRTIALEVKTITPERPPPPPRAPGMSGRRVAAFVTGGVGAAGLVVGAITGGLMLSKKGAIRAGCKDGGGGVELCNAAGASAGNSAKTLGAVASAGFITGLCGVGVAVALFVTEPRRAKADAARGAPGSRIEVGALSLSPAGTTVGVQGSF